MNLILLGPPGAGKGTQAEFICAKYEIPTISTGNILRAAIKDGTDLGQKAKSFMDKGSLVPDDIIIGILGQALNSPSCAKGFILDGVPRTIAQAEAIEAMGIQIDKVLEIVVQDEKIVKRMGGRRACEGCGATYHLITKPSRLPETCDLCGSKTVIRKDDVPETVLDRLRAYHEQTEPLVTFYKERGTLVAIDNVETIAETSTAIAKVLEAIN